MPTLTTTYGFSKPTIGGDGDDWGDDINLTFDMLDDILDGTSPITPAAGNDIEIRGTNAATNTVTTLLTLNSQSSGTPAAGIGAGLAFAAETAAGNTEVGVVLEAVTTDVTGASEDFDLVIKTMAAGAAAAERLRLSSSVATFATGINMTAGGLQRGGVNAYALRSVTYLTSGTAATYTTPTGCRALRVTAIGAGGGGGGVDGQGAGTAAAGGGGGPGAEVVKFITSPEASYTYTIGAAGTGGAAGANDGAAGGNTTFAGGAVNLAANGGAGGAGITGASGNTSGGAGAGGTGTGGDLNIEGSRQARARTVGSTIYIGGLGGSTRFGAGGNSGSILADGAGQAASGYGSGGGGASVAGAATNYAGGDGTGGLIIVEEYF